MVKCSQGADAAIESSAAMENTSRATSTHPDGVAARDWDGIAAFDWTAFDADGQASIMLSLLTQHGRATPLLWLTVDKAALKNRRNEYEYQALGRFADALPADIKVCIHADRGFGYQKLYRMLTEELKFDYVILYRATSR